MELLNYSSSKQIFLQTADKSTNDFAQNSLVLTAHNGKMTINDYHNYLITIFHQVRSSSSTFALAAGHCSEKYLAIKDYLFHHAEEEKTHWHWILDDLKSTGYKGPDIERHFPPVATQSYIAFNYFIAQRFPIARLGIAYMLESIGAKLGKASAQKICATLNLKPEQASFLYGHGDTDVGHVKDIIEILDKSDLNAEDWAWMTYAAHTASALYKQMYEHVVACR